MWREISRFQHQQRTSGIARLGDKAGSSHPYKRETQQDEDLFSHETFVIQVPELFGREMDTRISRSSPDPVYAAILPAIFPISSFINDQSIFRGRLQDLVDDEQVEWSFAGDESQP